MNKSTPQTEVLATRLRKTRIRSGFTQRALADAVGIGDTAIANYESGKNGPRAPVLKRLAETLHVDPGYLLGDQTEQRSEHLQLTEVSSEPEKLMHPKIESLIEALMAEEGFQSREECLASAIREMAASRGIRAVGKTPGDPAPKKHDTRGIVERKGGKIIRKVIPDTPETQPQEGLRLRDPEELN